MQRFWNRMSSSLCREGKDIRGLSIPLRES